MIPKNEDNQYNVFEIEAKFPTEQSDLVYSIFL